MPPKAGKENLDDLKQELDIDFHKITCDELYKRFQTHPDNVSFVSASHRHSNRIFSLSGSDSCQGEGEFRARWTECADTTKADTGMDQILSESIRRVRATTLDRSDFVLHRLSDSSDDSRGSGRRQSLPRYCAGNSRCGHWNLLVLPGLLCCLNQCQSDQLC